MFKSIKSKIALAAVATAGVASSASASIYTTQSTFDAGVAGGDVSAILLDTTTVYSDVSSTFGAVIGVIILMWGLRKVYVSLTRS